MGKISHGQLRRRRAECPCSQGLGLAVVAGGEKPGRRRRGARFALQLLRRIGLRTRGASVRRQKADDRVMSMRSPRTPCVATSNASRREGDGEIESECRNGLGVGELGLC